MKTHHPLTLEIWRRFTQQPKAPELDDLDELVRACIAAGSNSDEFTWEEGSTCPVCREDYLIIKPDGNCLCSLGNPPCGPCENSGLACKTCGVFIRSL